MSRPKRLHPALRPSDDIVIHHHGLPQNLIDRIRRGDSDLHWRITRQAFGCPQGRISICKECLEEIPRSEPRIRFVHYVQPYRPEEQSPGYRDLEGSLHFRCGSRKARVKR